MDGLRWPRDEAGIDKPIGSHFFYDGSSFKGFSSLMDGIMVRRGGSGVVLR